jgi:hypothetical protein
MHRNQRADDHQKFRELAALARAHALADGERLELENHLRQCAACHQVYGEYSLLHTEGMAYLAAACDQSPESELWDSRSVRNELLDQVREAERRRPGLVEMDRPRRVPGAFLDRAVAAQWATAAMAACLILGVAAGAYHLAGRAQSNGQLTPAASVSDAEPAPQELSSQNFASQAKAAQELLASETQQIARLQARLSGEQQDIAGLRTLLRAAQDRSAGLAAADSKRDELFRQVSEERDQLAGQLRDAEKTYELVRAELTNLRADHDRTLLHTASLESKVEELSAATRDQDRRLKDDEQYLASDRDIRELMGARKLYIADVFDVDSGSHTRKSFGRVFYTQNKSLIFYAFDLDHEPGIKNASAFQVWGQRDAELGEKPRPMNLGILYMDSESNRRWVLRLDDPKQLGEIDAVFVTVEPHGGSQKPTGKPFLYALLRKEANHP